MRTTLSATSLAENMLGVDHSFPLLDMCEKDSSVNSSMYLLKGSMPCEHHVCLSFARFASQKDHKCWKCKRQGDNGFSSVGEIAGEVDHTHNAQRAQRIGPSDHVIPPAVLRPYLIKALEREIQRELQRTTNQNMVSSSE